MLGLSFFIRNKEEPPYTCQAGKRERRGQEECEDGPQEMTGVIRAAQPQGVHDCRGEDKGPGLGVGSMSHWELSV